MNAPDGSTQESASREGGHDRVSDGSKRWRDIICAFLFVALAALSFLLGACWVSVLKAFPVREAGAAACAHPPGAQQDYDFLMFPLALSMFALALVGFVLPLFANLTGTILSITISLINYTTGTSERGSKFASIRENLKEIANNNN